MNRNAIRGKKILVTGGAGVIGKELLELLNEKGGIIMSIDKNHLLLKEKQSIVHLQRDLVSCDLKEIHDFAPQIIFHLAAAFERSKESPSFWGTNWHDNVLLSHRMVDLAKDIDNLETFVFASSYLVYSPTLYLSPKVNENIVHLMEDDLKEPRNITGAAKFYTEKELDFIKEYHCQSLRIIQARIFRVYGFGSKDVVCRWIRTALSGESIDVYNAENRFDFVFARDIAQGLLRLAESPDAKGPVNLGSGVARSIQDVLSMLVRCVPVVQSKIRDLGTREPFEASCANLTRLKQLTGWVPFTDLEKGIKMLIEFEQNRASYEVVNG